jgi:hypothetical protein
VFEQGYEDPSVMPGESATPFEEKQMGQPVRFTAGLGPMAVGKLDLLHPLADIVIVGSTFLAGSGAGPSASDNVFWVLLQDTPDGGRWPIVISKGYLDMTPNPDGVALGDFYGDGFQDIAVACMRVRLRRGRSSDSA